MAISLYDVTVTGFIQHLAAVEGFLAKGLEHGIDPAAIVETRLHSDMLPFRFQIQSVAHHSWGAIKGAMAGEFAPPQGPEADYAGLQALVAEARAGLEGVRREEVNALEGRDLLFRLGERSMPFVADQFLLTFSIPNFHFHATTAYDILRQAGVPLGKRDYLGRLRMKG